MKNNFTIKKTNTNDADFRLLISHLDNELWNELKEDQATYDQYNKVPGLPTAVLIYENKTAVACGCFKKHDDHTVEIKRMFVEKEYRRKGLSKMVLEALEKWAASQGFQYAILETSIHFEAAKTLYQNAGYAIIPNYDQYIGLEESVCMKKKLMSSQPSEFKQLGNIEYFDFEEDFMEDGIRCIPMIIRFKLDKAGIKLKLGEWVKFSSEEKIRLALLECNEEKEIKNYQELAASLVHHYTHKEATELSVDKNPSWGNKTMVPAELLQKAMEAENTISKEQWQSLTMLQRFALLKLCRSSHENKNFPIALKEFGLIQ